MATQQMTAALPRSTTESRNPIMNTVRSEWSKLMTQRGSHLMLILAAIASIGITAMFSWGIGVSWNEMSAAEQAEMAPLELSMIGIFFAGIIFVIIAASVVTNEYATGMIRQTMTVTPNRSRVVLAKIAVVMAYMLVPIFVITYATVWVGQQVLAANNVPTADVFGSDLAIVGGMSLSGLFYPIVTVGAAFLLRSSAATVAVVMLSMFFPALFGGMFPASIQENVLAYLPGNAVDALVLGGRGPENPQYLDQPLAAVVVVAWIALITGLSIWRVNSRDVG